jgi:predicted ribosome quality control (RQC) complex YloA/Tae2 family protein
VGAFAGLAITAGDLNIDIGNLGFAGEANTIRIGDINQARTFIAGISGTAVVGNTVVVDANGQLGTATSSARFKKEIKPMDKTSEAILALKPVSFQYKSDSKGTPQFGLIAEEVAKVNPDLVVYDRKGEIYSVRYEAVNAMLLNEFLKEHRTVQELKSTVAKQEAAAAKQEATIARQQNQIEALTMGLQKVSDQLQLSGPAPRTVVDNR